MKHIKSILLFAGLLIHFTCIGQNDTIIKKGMVNFATLVVDYQTYEFEGGNMAYYSCDNCNNDSIPFLIDYDSPGDFGGITYTLSPTGDTLFDATIIWAGTGQLLYPTEFKIAPPFYDGETPVSKPNDIRYIGQDGGEMNAYVLEQADPVWDVIDLLEITKLFSNNEYEAAIYWFTPSVGSGDPSVAKWIVFLYYYDNTTSIDYSEWDKKSFKLYPNPAESTIQVKQENTQINIANYRLYNTAGQTMKQGSIDDPNDQIDVSLFPPGLYYAELLDKSGNLIKTEEFIKK